VGIYLCRPKRKKAVLAEYLRCTPKYTGKKAKELTEHFEDFTGGAEEAGLTSDTEKILCML